MGYRKLSARPRHHAQAEGAIEAFKKASPRVWTRSRASRASTAGGVEVWFADEARIGQKNKITRRWAKRGTPAVGAAGPAHGLDLHLRRDLPRDRAKARASSCPGATPRRWACTWPRSPRGSRRASTPRCWSIRPDGTSRPGSTVPRQHHHRPAAREVPRAEPAGERLAVHARQLALQPRVPLLRRHRRSLLRRLEQARDQPWRIMSIGLRDWTRRS